MISYIENQLTYTRFLRDSASFLTHRKGFYSFDHEISREITTDETDHLVVVEACDRVVVWGAVEHFPYLLQKTLSVQLGCGYESILSQQDMLSFESGVEAIIMFRLNLNCQINTY